MNKTYLLDTNALFNYVKYKITYSSLDTESQKIIDELEGNKCYISEITTIEIVSVLGKYARGGLGAAKKMKTKQIKAWKKLIDQILNQDKYIVTSDKSLICALSANNIPYWNAFICKV